MSKREVQQRKTIRMNQTQVLELNNTMSELKNSLENFKTKLSQVEELVNQKTR